LKHTKVAQRSLVPFEIISERFVQDSLEPRSSVYHNAVTFQNAFMHAGTTSDAFLRDNLDWLAYASNWSKFTATAALGVIHKGNFEQSMVILGPYLPGENGGESNLAGAAYSEGGALYGLGLINAGVGAISSGVGGRTIEDYLRNILKAAQGEVVQHGAALGLGIAGMGGRNMEAYDDLKQTLFTDTAVGGEAAGYAMGLIMLGTGDPTIKNEMLTYTRETQHEKIIRGLAIGLAFLYYGRQDQADGIAKELLAEKVSQLLCNNATADISLRILFFDMAASTPSRSRTLGHPIMMLFVDCYTLLFRIPRAMFAGLRSLALLSYSSRTPVRSLE
jgi:26S proteasome regulatory subunit N2